MTEPTDVRPRVHVISLGGTIASTGDAATGVLPALDAAALIAAVPQIDAVAAITTEQLAQVGSASLTVEIVLDVVRAGVAALAEGAVGVVVTQGTDTLEETAYLLSVLNPADRPFVVTGAMRNPTLPGADGPANLLAAVTVAANAALEGIRAVVVLSDEIHDPALVHKAHVSSTATFTSGPEGGPVGWVVEGEVRLRYRPAADNAVELPGGPVPAVALVPAGLGEDLRLLDALPGLGYAGVVIDGVGGGHVPADAPARVEALARQLPVVLASRTGSGRMLARTYGYPGSEIDLLGRGLLTAGPLSGRKARLLLAVLLANDALDTWPY